jgi:hypothetical protein
MRILVTKTTRAAPDGVTVRSYRAGETAEMPEDLARVFLREGWGREADAPASGLDASGPGWAGRSQPQTNGARDEKAMEAAPANKALDGAPENKTPPNPRRTKRRRRRRKRAPAGQ